MWNSNCVRSLVVLGLGAIHLPNKIMPRLEKKLWLLMEAPLATTFFIYDPLTPFGSGTPLANGEYRRHIDKTKLSCLVRVGDMSTIGDKTRQFCLVSTHFPICNCSVSNIMRIGPTENLEIENWDKTRQKCL